MNSKMNTIGKNLRSAVDKLNKALTAAESAGLIVEMGIVARTYGEAEFAQDDQIEIHRIAYTETVTLEM